MSKLSKTKRQELNEKLNNKDLPFAVRKAAYEEIKDGFMNPKAKNEFDPATYDPFDTIENYDVKKRNRVEPPRVLPTMGMHPKEIIEGQNIGLFESKQDLYLLIAWLSQRVSDLEDQINNP